MSIARTSKEHFSQQTREITDYVVTSLLGANNVPCSTVLGPSFRDLTIIFIGILDSLKNSDN